MFEHGTKIFAHQHINSPSEYRSIKEKLLNQSSRAVQNRDTLNQKWLEEATELLEHYSVTPGDLSIILLNYSKTHYAKSRKHLETKNNFLGAWQSDAAKKIKEFSLWDLDTSIRAFTNLDIMQNEIFLAAWKIGVIKKIEECDPQELAAIIDWLAKSAVLLDQELIDILGNKAIEKIKEYSPQELAIVTPIIRKVKEFNPQALTIILQEPQRLSIELSKEFLDWWEDVVIKKIEEFTPQQLAIIVQRFEQLAIQPGQKFLEACGNEVIKKIEEFSPQELAIILQALPKLGVEPSRIFLGIWESATIKKISEFSPQDLVDIIHGFSTLAIEPSSEFIEAFEAEFIKKIEEFSFQELAVITHGFAKLGIKPSSEFIKGLENRIIKKNEKFNLRYLTSLIHTFAILKVMDCAISEDCTNILIASLNGKSLNPINQHQLFLASKIFPTYPQLEKMGRVAISPENKESSLQKSVCRALKRKLGKCIKIKEEEICEALRSPIDITLNFSALTGEPKTLLVQVDGPHHYVKNPAGDEHLNGNSLLQNAILEQAGLEYIRIPYKDVNLNIHDAVQPVLEKIKADAGRDMAATSRPQFQSSRWANRKYETFSTPVKQPSKLTAAKPAAPKLNLEEKNGEGSSRPSPFFSNPDGSRLGDEPNRPIIGGKLKIFGVSFS
ncbi:MAG: repeat-containing protein 04 [Rickettsiaceae bacterium]|jgi:uncharacterized protein YfkK (UPF0435 family)|nr:repeat-containing protein 04 [Rickettsiaceae bacterium]